MSAIPATRLQTCRSAIRQTLKLVVMLKASALPQETHVEPKVHALLEGKKGYQSYGLVPLT
ncbi:hypothetical protein [Sphingobium sp. BS19]|uniref:hypothetical protein n=1 Tax=Sphingobium sp. BS19 TaxID=3018973 RepID=UPI00248FB52F|nr:hypothetical protein [Sphingobium sp. BS19]